MKKRTHLIVALHIVAAVVLVAALAMLISERTPTGGHTSFQNMPVIMTKIDPSGNEIGRWTVSANGETQRYSNGRLAADVTLSAFDDIASIALTNGTITQLHGALQTHWNGYHYLKCTASPSGEKYWLAFEDNLDRWALFSAPGEPFYVGYTADPHHALPARYTIEQLVEYFNLDNWIGE